MDVRLSASQVTTLFRCPREWIYKYVLQYKTEPAQALAFGTAFHAVMDGQEPDMRGLDESGYPYNQALKVMRDAANKELAALPEEVAREVRIERPGMLGFVDKVVAKPNGKWKIVDYKTCSVFDKNSPAMVPGEIQMITYVAMRQEVADACDLLAEDFDGIAYIKIRKPTERRKKAESVVDLASRLTCEARTYNFSKNHFHQADVIFETTYSYARHLLAYAKETYERNYSPTAVAGNQQACVRYGKPCPFFGFCYPGVKVEETSEEDS